MGGVFTHMLGVGAASAGGGAPSFVGSATGGANSNSYSVDVSGIGIQEDDIVIVVTGFSSNGTNLAAITCSGNNSGGYTLNTQMSEGGDTWDTQFKVFYTIQGATVDTSLSIGAVATSARGSATAVHVWRNIDTASPIDTTGTAASGTNTGRGNPPAITPTNAGAIILACGLGAQAPSGSAYTIPSGMANGASAFQDGTTSGSGALIASDVWVSGSYDPAAWTGGSDSTSASWVAQTIALKPA
jgi:hypothetical protein